MSDASLKRTMIVANRAGMHARAAAMIAVAVRRFNARVTITKSNNQVEATDVLQLLSLGAAQGEEVEVEASGDEAQQAIDALQEMFVTKFGED
jgi:phosphotransferase system HPr (HPr) family protein